ncbi:hypothetical protein O0544_16840 [Edwardsiella anguillarum]|nr:hypothetical protein [Edwardsiella anguillarum]
MLEKAAELGAHPYFDCPLHAVQAERDGVRLLGPRGEWRARRVALCAGAWVRALLPTLPLQTRCKPFAGIRPTHASASGAISRPCMR